jgi:hypothetical protein
LGQTLELLSASSRSYVSDTYFASIILYILSAVLAKVSTLYLMMRLFNLHGRKAQTNHHKNHQLYIYTCFAILVIMITWGAASIVAVSVKCTPSTMALPPDESQCTSQFLRWQVITGFDVATEILLVMVAMLIVAPVQLSLYLKFQVVCAFAFRLPLVALAVLRLHYVGAATTAENPGTALTPILVLQQVYLCWSIISATLPNLKAFVRSFGSGFGIGIDMETYTNAYGSKQRSYEMNKMSGTHNNGSSNRSMDHGTQTAHEVEDKEYVRPVRTVSSQQGGLVHGHQLPGSSHGEPQQHDKQGDLDSIESTSSDAQIIRKHIDWTVRYEDEGYATAPRAI